MESTFCSNSSTEVEQKVFGVIYIRRKLCTVYCLKKKDKRNMPMSDLCRTLN